MDVKPKLWTSTIHDNPDYSQLFVSNEGMCSTVHCSSSSSWTFSTLEDFLHCVWGSDVVSCWIIRTFQKPKRPSRSPKASRSVAEAKLFVCTVYIKLIFLSLILDYCYTCVYPSRRLPHAGRRTFNVISTWVSRYKRIAVSLRETIIVIHECLPSAIGRIAIITIFMLIKFESSLGCMYGHG